MVVLVLVANCASMQTQPVVQLQVRAPKHVKSAFILNAQQEADPMEAQLGQSLGESNAVEATASQGEGTPIAMFNGYLVSSAPGGVRLAETGPQHGTGITSTGFEPVTKPEEKVRPKSESSGVNNAIHGLESKLVAAGVSVHQHNDA